MVGNGTQIDIMKDRWLASGICLKNLTPPVEGKVSTLFQSNQRCWDVQKIRDSFPPTLSKQVLQTPISWLANQDILYWPHSSNREISVKSAYKSLKRKEQNCNAGNQVAHLLAALALQDRLPPHWQGAIPQQVQSQISRDKDLLRLQDGLGSSASTFPGGSF
ncbi:hypothetical protein SESBI_02503 [Sesbania bispinosa]|nr:hypothetical protein SESBI_02503 [Sesbania bispinosa]